MEHLITICLNRTSSRRAKEFLALFFVLSFSVLSLTPHQAKLFITLTLISVKRTSCGVASNESSLVEIFQTTLHFTKKKTSNLLCLCALMHMVLQSRSSEGIAPSIWCSLQFTRKVRNVFPYFSKRFDMLIKRPSKENDENYLKPSV